ncbi:MAG TPA: asparagine synthase (glutamine-hydrolyzing) [Ignavibacteriaceae bacterium]|mgnify:CR=1 FL=1|nr:asparagine synthase (glutamine-hydrolyzing) [Ignavibacteriaceae bacterium]
MCGICGIINFNNKPVDEISIREMMQKLKHRGPDDDGVFINGRVGLGFVRLSILDLSSAGHQPMKSRDSRYIIVFNGEVYNYIEIRDELRDEFIFISGTDTEVVLYSYIKWGEACLDRFNGMFAFVIYDTMKNSLFLARDRFGVKPMYYFVNNQTLYFASEIKAILPFIQDLKPNLSCVSDYLVTNRTDHNNNTFFDKVQKFPKGSYAYINSSLDFNIKKWYNLKEKLFKETYNDFIEFQEDFYDSIKLRLRSDVDVGVCISGGLDSSSIASTIIHKFNKKDFYSFSAVYNEGDYGDESEFINEYSKQITKMKYCKPNSEIFLENVEDFVYTLTEPVGGLGPFIQYLVMKLVNEHKIKVVLNGQGADEQFAGYDYFYASYFLGLVKKMKFGVLLRELYAYQRYNKNYNYLSHYLLYLFPAEIKKHFILKRNKYVVRNILSDNESNILSQLYSPNNLSDSLYQHFEYKLEHLLKWEDLNSMRFGIESRLPFMDYRIIEKVLSLPETQIIKKGKRKYFLRESMKPILPVKIYNRNHKLGFDNPSAEWFREDKLKLYVLNILNSKTLHERGVFKQDVCVDLYNRHLLRENDYSKEIWKIINLELWFRKFFD